MSTWPLAAKARTDFADMMEPLNPSQAAEQSLCNEWTAEGVLGHITSFVETGLGQMFITMAKSGFDFDKVSIAMTKTQLARPMSDVIDSLRANASKSASMPTFPESMTVTDVAIHTQDVRRPLGLDGELDEKVLSTALEFLTTNKKAKMMIDRPNLKGVKLVATDTDWSWGEGAEIKGTAEALLMALANRDVLSELSGEGLANWATSS